MMTPDQLAVETRRAAEAMRAGGSAFSDYLRECPAEVDVRYLLDVAFYGDAHYAGCPTSRDPEAACVCRLGMLRTKYRHPAVGATVTVGQSPGAGAERPRGAQ